MEKFKSLNRYQKGVLLFMLAMTLVFAVIYARTISRVGFEYGDSILVPSQENGSIVYSGKVQWEQAHFTVSEDKTVVFQYGEKTYGPYTAKEDPTAIPEGEERAEYMTGVELRRGEDVLFRGGVLDMGGYFWLCNEDGSLKDKEISIVTTNGSVMYVNGKAVDPAEPSVSTILDLMSEPELTHKGNWGVWFCAVFICVLNALSILFADELFHFNLMFLIRDAEYAEPSDWEMAGRYAGWIGLPIVALIILVIGLQ